MMKPSTVHYRISFYEPDGHREPADFDALTPFPAVNVGDELLGGIWDNAPYPFPPKSQYSPVATVTKVQHFYQTVADVLHCIVLVHSTALPEGD